MHPPLNQVWVVHELIDGPTLEVLRRDAARRIDEAAKAAALAVEATRPRWPHPPRPQPPKSLRGADRGEVEEAKAKVAEEWRGATDGALSELELAHVASRLLRGVAFLHCTHNRHGRAAPSMACPLDFC